MKEVDNQFVIDLNSKLIQISTNCTDLDTQLELTKIIKETTEKLKTQLTTK